MKQTSTFLIMISLCICITNQSIFAQKKGNKKADKAGVTNTPTEKPAKKPEAKKVADVIKKHKKFDGLFTLYQDTTSGEVKMLIKDEQIGQEFIHFYYVENGAVEASAFRGQFRGSKVFKIEKYFNKIEFIEQNTSSYFDPNNALSKAADANISPAILFSGKIEAGSKQEGQYIVKGNDVFLSEAFGFVKPPPPPRSNPRAFKLGSLSKSKTKYKALKNYPQNTDVIVEYVYDNRAPSNFGSRAVTDARSVSIKVQHSLIAVPENDYEPRYDDPRVGYFTTQVTDMTTPDEAPYRDLIHRWNLKKKDPNAAISEPVKPIVWWIENTTPVEWRETIKDGVLAWNKAFEKAGFKNAMVVKIQPDDADWDAGDIRYNVLRWTSSPNPPFGGYGPSFVNPRTGEIMGADIMLEYVFMSNRVLYDKLYTNEIGYAEIEHPFGHEKFCSFGHMMQETMMFGTTALQMINASRIEMEGLKKEGLKQLIMHEVGHTIGLNHNMKSSQAYSTEQLYDQDFVIGKALTGSVMDYATINLRPDLKMKGGYYSAAVGPYDVWAIESGYKIASDTELEKILSRSTEPELAFGNDADDMRSPGRHLDPRINTGDLASNQVDYCIDRMNLTRELIQGIKEKYTAEDGESYQALRIAYNILQGQYASAGNIISRYIGGVYVDRAMTGQKNAPKPFEPVPAAEQIKAMNALKDYIFAPDAFKTPNEIYNYLQIQRRGFGHFGIQEDPHIHDYVVGAQKRVLAHLLHPNTVKRISDSELYGNGYSLSKFMTDLNDAVFKADAYGNVNSFRQNLQIEYTKLLIKAMGDTKGIYTNMAKSMCLYNLQNIKKIASSNAGNVSTRAHRQHLKLLIDKALEK